MKNILYDYVSYNLWANQKIVEYLTTEDSSQREMLVNNSFPSINATLLHIADAEALWLERLKGNSPKVWPSKHLNIGPGQVLRFVVNCSVSFKAFVLSQDLPYFEQRIKINTMSGMEFNQHTTKMIHHCMNHSTYHRGQIITISKQLGFQSKAPSTDMIVYYRELESNN